MTLHECGRVPSDGWITLIVWLGRYRRKDARAANVLCGAGQDFYFDVGHAVSGNACAEQGPGGWRA